MKLYRIIKNNVEREVNTSSLSTFLAKGFTIIQDTQEKVLEEAQETAKEENTNKNRKKKKED